MSLATPQVIRDQMIAAYTESHRRAGIAMTADEIERLVVADCLLVDAVRNAGELGTPRPRTAPAPARQRPDAVLEAQLQTGTELRMNAGAKAQRFRPLHGNPVLVGARWGAAVARIGKLLERTGKAATIGGAVTNAEHPKLAKEFAEAWSHFMTRAQLAPVRGIDHNPYRGLSDKDASRAFMRAVEDICDRSTGSMGAWWVK